MKEDELNHRLRELIDIASGQKTKRQSEVVAKVLNQKEETKKQVARIANSLQELRMCIKYLMFDVEATRRERDRLQSRINNKLPPPPPD